MAKVTFQTVIAECEAFKVEVEGSVLSRVELAILEMAYLRGQQSELEEELVRLEKEVA
tara:strand:+ start:1732 stop:1905 length:174 start_codon:yes stop_codon:yes gene_type:complete